LEQLLSPITKFPHGMYMVSLPKQKAMKSLRQRQWNPHKKRKHVGWNKGWVAIDDKKKHTINSLDGSCAWELILMKITSDSN
jgi:hypothetical protein